MFFDEIVKQTERSRIPKSLTMTELHMRASQSRRIAQDVAGFKKRQAFLKGQTELANFQQKKLSTIRRFE